MNKPILCLDFDGVIHAYTTKWSNAWTISDGPVPGAVPALLRYLDAGLKVAIYSSRSKSIRGRWAMKRWLGKQIREHWEAGGSSTYPSFVEAECWADATGIYRKFSWPWFKPSAMMTIDDRALTFNGDWSDAAYAPDALRAFKPWNKTPQKIEPHRAFDFGALRELRRASP